MKQLALAVTLTVDNALTPSRVAAAIKRVLSWALFNDVEGAEVLAYGTVEDTIQVTEMAAGIPVLGELARPGVGQAIQEVWAAWNDAYVVLVCGKVVSVVGDVGAARHAAREAARSHGRSNVSLVQLRPNVEF